MSHRMRRALSILLVLLFGAGPVSFAFNSSDEASVPACCRRLGAHHCAMDSRQSAGASGNAAVKARSRCPQFPQHSDARTNSYATASGFYQPAVPAARENKCSVPAPNRSSSIHFKTPVLRGPPATRES